MCVCVYTLLESGLEWRYSFGSLSIEMIFKAVPVEQVTEGLNVNR